MSCGNATAHLDFISKHTPVMFDLCHIHSLMEMEKWSIFEPVQGSHDMASNHK